MRGYYHASTLKYHMGICLKNVYFYNSWNRIFSKEFIPHHIQRLFMFFINLYLWRGLETQIMLLTAQKSYDSWFVGRKILGKSHFFVLWFFIWKPFMGGFFSLVIKHPTRSICDINFCIICIKIEYCIFHFKRICATKQTISSLYFKHLFYNTKRTGSQHLE